MSDYDVLVIGAGQAGLAAAHALRVTGVSHLLLEAGDAVGGAWPHYYDSLTLFSPARFGLPGLTMQGNPARYPTRDETIAYLRAYADHFDVPVRTRANVVAVTSRGEYDLEVRLSDGDVLTARAVIAATGGFTNPYLPRIPGRDAYAGQVLHVAAYRNPIGFEGQRVVVVGAGNSAVQVAHELASVADVTLASRGPIPFRKQRPLGIDLHYWVSWSGIDRLPLGRRAGGSVGVLDDGRYAAAIGAGALDHRPMFTTLTTDGVEWSDGTAEPVDTVLLATGYRPQLSYLPSEAFAADSWPLHSRGVSTTVPGLGFIGLPGQTGIASATLRGVGPDARRVVRRLVRHLPVNSRPRPSAVVAQT